VLYGGVCLFCCVGDTPICGAGTYADSRCVSDGGCARVCVVYKTCLCERLAVCVCVCASVCACVCVCVTLCPRQVLWSVVYGFRRAFGQSPSGVRCVRYNEVSRYALFQLQTVDINCSYVRFLFDETNTFLFSCILHLLFTFLHL